MTDWNFGQWAMTIWLGLILLSSYTMNGKPRANPNYSAGDATVSVFILVLILVCGGFY